MILRRNTCDLVKSCSAQNEFVPFSAIEMRLMDQIASISFSCSLMSESMISSCSIGVRATKRGDNSTDARLFEDFRLISTNHFSQSHLFDTSDWRSIWDLTLTLKQARKTDDGLRWIRTDEYQCREAFRHFMNLLNRAVYGNAYRRNCKKLRVLPILEKASEDERNRKLRGRWHFHAAIEPPTHIEADRFKTLIQECWYKVDWEIVRFVFDRMPITIG